MGELDIGWQGDFHKITNSQYWYIYKTCTYLHVQCTFVICINIDLYMLCLKEQITLIKYVLLIDITKIIVSRIKLNVIWKQ